jgi:hypothetical protein
MALLGKVWGGRAEPVPVNDATPAGVVSNGIVKRAPAAGPVQPLTVPNAPPTYRGDAERGKGPRILEAYKQHRLDREANKSAYRGALVDATANRPLAPPPIGENYGNTNGMLAYGGGGGDLPVGYTSFEGASSPTSATGGVSFTTLAIGVAVLLLVLFFLKK